MVNTLWKLFSGGMTLFIVVMLCFHIAIQKVSGGNIMDWKTIFLALAVAAVVFAHVFVEVD